MLLQKVLSSLLVVVLGLGTVVCPCAAIANDGEAGSHSHHQSDTSAPEHSDCSHAGCLNDCNCLSAEVSDELAALPVTRSIDVDDFTAIELETIAYPHPSPMVVSTGPPLRHVSRPADTPVRRHDRLLD